VGCVEGVGGVDGEGVVVAFSVVLRLVVGVGVGVVLGDVDFVVD